MFWLKKDNVSIRTSMKSSSILIGGPAGLLNRISSMASSYKERDVYTIYLSISDKSLLIMAPWMRLSEWLLWSGPAAAFISEDAMDSDVEILVLKILVTN